MADTTLTNEQLTTMLEISKDLQRRIASNGMPELDEDLAEMIELLEGAVDPLAIESIYPDEMAVPGVDQEMEVTGTGFAPSSVINWNGADEVTEFISDTKLRTIVKTSMVEAPLPFELQVYVRNGEDKSNSVTFTFTEAIARKGKEESHKHKHR